MSLPYFLSDDPTSGIIEGPEAKHAQVKRIQPGERIMLFLSLIHISDPTRQVR